ncbi:MAG: acetyl-CoA C-acyltransferase [Pseudomonadota bacterium]
MKAVYLVSPLRSPIGKAFKGGLATSRPDNFCADVVRAVVKQAGDFDPGLIEDLILGCAMPEAEQGMNIGRMVGLLAGLPETVPGVTVNRFCSSGLQTIAMAYERIASEQADCILAGGVESMSAVPMMGHKIVGSRKIMDTRPDMYLSMGLTAENVAEDFKITRDEQDEFSFESHRKASKAIAEGMFHDEIVPIDVERRRPGKNGQVIVDTMKFAMDDGPRADTTLEALKALRTAFKMGGSVSAGSSSQMSDGAAMTLVCSEDFVKKHNLKPMARFLGFSVAGVPPRVMGIGPIEAIGKVLKRTGIKLSDLDHIELNEAFAAQALAVIKTVGLDPKKVNPYGGAIALGHPLGATGAKLVATACHALKRNQGKYGLITMCIGTGMGAAGLIERV